MRPRIDLSLPVGYGLQPRQLVELTQHAERVGVEGVACGELAACEAMSMLGAIAVSTERIHLESSIGAVVVRSPALYAMAAATLHDLSRGRFALGLGAGSPVVAAFHGADFSHPLDQVRTSVDAVRRALAGQTLKEYGSFRLRGLRTGPVPVLVSAMNEGMVRLAGHHADGMILNFSDAGACVRLGEVARKARADAGIQAPFDVHTIVWLSAGDDVEGARERFRHEAAPYLAVSTYRRAAVALAGEDAVRTTAEAFDAGGRAAAAAVFPDAIVDALLATGTPEQIAARVGLLAEAGCAGVRFTPVTEHPEDLGENLRVVELLGAVVDLLGPRGD